MTSSAEQHLGERAIRACAVVPVFNHGSTVGRVIAALREQYELPCIVVNDASRDDTAAVLERIVETDDHVTVVQRPQNGGKGAAVKDGLKRAASMGFTHALQVDADGQHALDDAPNLLEQARLHPDALILGQPEFDASAPRARVWGRKVTDFWVGLETWSLSPPDTMCGFRVYPLARCSRLLAKRRLGNRMDFDIDIVVRLYWQGAPMRHVRTQVTYPEDGRSNFQPLGDNLRISWLHTRLFFEMVLWQWMFLLRRDLRPAESKGQPWNEPARDFDPSSGNQLPPAAL